MAKRKAASVALAVRGDTRERDNQDVVGTDPIIAEARRRWQKCEEAEDAQRKSILEAKRFRAGDQWPEAIKIQRQGSSAIQGVAAQPARPCLTVDRLSQPVRQVSNQIKQANFAIDVLPNGFGADDETAEIFKGYLRRVQNQARGESPIEWAGDQAAEGGIGWFRIRTDYVHETWDGDTAAPEAYDQELRLERITNNLSVYCDPSAVKPTRSDALFMFVTEDLDREDFTSRWPRADVRSLDEFESTGDMKGWVSKDTIRIAEYWRVTFTDVTLKASDRTRVMRRPKVEGFKITATEVLERWEWVGSRIPLVPVLGEELNVDGRTVLRGIIQSGMDAQRMVNYTYSGAMETFALAPKSPFVAAAGQIDNYKQIWDTANVYNYSYLPYDPVSIAGTPAPPPQRQNAEAPIQAAVMLMQASEEAIKATTGYYASGLGDTTSKAVSGRAKQAEIQQSEIGSAHIPDNVRRALIYAGELMVEIIPKITRPGQIVHILGMDDQAEQVIVGQPYHDDPQTGKPVPMPQLPPEIAQLKQGMVKFYDLKNGRYSVTVDVGKASATKREEGAAALGELIPHLPPPMAAVATPEYVRQLSFPGAQRIAEKIEKALPPELQEQEEGQDPRLQALQQQNQQLQHALESKYAEEQAKQQAIAQRELAKAQVDAQVTLQKAQIDADVRIKVAQISAQAGLTEAALKAGSDLTGHQVARDEQLIGNDHELRVQAIDHEHEAHMASVEHQQALQQGAQQAQIASQQQASQQGHEAAMAAQQQQQPEAGA